MAGIRLYQPNGVGLLNEAGAQHPAPVEIDVDQICQLAFTGSTHIYRWFLSKPSNSASVLSSGSSAGPSFMPDIEGGSYSISMFDEEEVEYILDIVTPTTGIGGGTGGGTSVTTTLEDYDELRAASFSGGAPPASIVILRRENVGDGGEGLFVLLEGDSTTPDNDGTVLIDGDGNRYKRAHTWFLDARWFGVVAYPTLAAAAIGTDSTAALQAAIRAVSVNSVGGAFAAATVVLPYGFIRHSTDYIEVSRRCQIKGQGKSSTFIVTDGTADFVFRFNGSGLATDGGNGDYASLRDLAIDTTSPGTTIGIFINAAHVTIKDVQIASVGGCGVQIGDPLSTTNSHRWTLEGVELFSVGSDGVYVYYGNAGSARGCHAIATGAYGFRDESNLGNYYFGCTTEGCAGPCFKGGGGTSRTNFFGCYGEGFGSELGAGAVWWGGYPSNDFASGDDGTALIAIDATNIFPYSMSSGTAYPSVGHARFLAGSADGLASAFGWTNPYPVTADNYRIMWDSSDLVWRLTRNASDVESDIVWEHMVRASDRHWSNFRVPNLLVGNGGVDGVRHTSGNAEPVAGMWYLGDRHIASEPGQNDPIMWVCTAQGGFGSARLNNTPYQKFDLIAVSGRCYEATVDANSDSSPPSFNFSSLYDTTTDGAQVWRYVGTATPGFVPVYGSSLGDISRVTSGPYWFSDPTEWSVDSFGRIVTTVNTPTSCFREVNVPVGASISKVTAFIAAPVHANLPGTMPRITLHRLQLSTNTTTSSAAAVDQTAVAADYDDPHVIERVMIPAVEQDGDRRFVLEFENENGANSASGLTIIEIFATFTPAAPDRGAS